MTKAYLSRNIEDANLTSPQNGNLLVYNSSSGKWEDSSFTTILTGEGVVKVEKASPTGHCGLWTGTEISTTPQTIIANGTGDVAEIITILYSVTDYTLTDIVNGVGGSTITLTPGSSANILSDGTNTLTLSCATNGSLTIAKSNVGTTNKYRVTLWMVWQ
jgi:hypothetical protein